MWRIAFFLLIIAQSCGNKKLKTSYNQSDVIFSIEDTTDIDTMDLGYAKLSQYGFFTEDLKELNPSKDVLPYELNATLFSDYAEKQRFIYLTSNDKLVYKDDLSFSYPDGSILIKNFYYESAEVRRIIETRLLVKENSTWKPLSYVWNKEQTEAYFWPIGKEILINHPLTQKTFSYEVPDLNQCKNCHLQKGSIQPIGPSPANWNLDISNKNQLTLYNQRIEKLPELEEIITLIDYNDEKYSIDDRARTYLHINCSSCHHDGGSARTSGLDLSIDNNDRFALGIHKSPIAAGKASGGRLYDIVPGKPDESILLYRMEKNDPSIRMPEIGRKMVHQEGVECFT